MADPVKNFAIAVVSTTYDDAATSIVLDTGGAAKFPDPATEGEFNVVWWNASSYSNPADDPNAEIVRVTAVSGETLTITRAQENTTASVKNVGDEYKIQLAPTAKTITDLRGGKVVPFSTQLTGTVSLTINDQTVTGSGTAFTTELSVGDRIYFQQTGAIRELGKVASIASDTELELETFGAGFTESGILAYKVETVFRIVDETNGRGLYVLDNGFIGINTDTPRYPVEINLNGLGDGADGFVITDNNSPFSGLVLSTNAIRCRYGGDKLTVSANDFYFNVWGTGFAIGDSTPAARFEVVGGNNALTDVGDSINYLEVLRYQSATNGVGAGLAFSVTNTDDNIGAAIIHERVGGNSQGTLRFYTKRVTTGGGAPQLAMTIDQNGDVTMTDDLIVTGNMKGGIGINSQSGTTYTLVLTDRGLLIDCDNASPIALTVPENASVAFPIGTKILIRQAGAGAVTISGSGAATLQTSLSGVTNGQYSVAGLIKVATDTWILMGDLVAA